MLHSTWTTGLAGSLNYCTDLVHNGFKIMFSGYCLVQLLASFSFCLSSLVLRNYYKSGWDLKVQFSALMLLDRQQKEHQAVKVLLQQC